MRKVNLLIGIVAAVSVLLAACGGDSGNLSEADTGRETLSQEEEKVKGEEKKNEEKKKEEKTKEDLNQSDENENEEEEYKRQCQAVDYKEYFRNDQKYIGEKIKIEVLVDQVIDGDCRGYDELGDEYYISDLRVEEDKFRIMEGDWIIVYGEFAGVGQITRAIGDYESDIFCIDGRYIDLYEEEDPAQIQPMAYDAAETEVEDIWAAGQADEYIFPDSDSRRLTEGELIVLPQDVLRIAKNEIYARHGRMFASEDLQLYFGSKSWYSGTIPGEQFSESVFNQIEKDNIALIQQYIDGSGGSGGTGYAGRGLTFEHPDAIPQLPGIYRYYADPSDLNSLCMELTIEHGGYVYVGFYLGGDQMQRSIILPNMMNDQIYTDESGSISFSCSDYGKYAYYEDNSGGDFSGMYVFVP